MTIRELLKSLQYKSVFNCLYKLYYKKLKYSQDEMTEIDCGYSQLFSDLKSLPQTNKESYKLYMTQTQSDDKIIDVCLLDEDNDEIMSLDNLKLEELIDLEIYQALKLNKTETLSHILYAINDEHTRR